MLIEISMPGSLLTKAILILDNTATNKILTENFATYNPCSCLN